MESVDAFVVAKQQGMIQQQIPNAGADRIGIQPGRF